MNIYKRGQTYHFEIQYGGKQYRRSTRSKNERTAMQVASAFHTALLKNDVGIVERKRAPQFPDAMKAFLAWSKREHAAKPATHKRYVTSSKPLLAFFKRAHLDKITPETVESYKATRSEDIGRRTGRALRPATVNRELACLRAMYNHAGKGLADLRNPVSRVKFLGENNQQERVLSHAEQAVYLAATRGSLRDIAGLILETGMRPEEVYTLHSAAVDLAGGFLRVVKSKTPAGKRRIELTTEARRILTARMDAAAGGYLFPFRLKSKTTTGRYDHTRPMLKANNAHDTALAASGLPPFRLYDLRHTWATRAAEAGIDPVTLAAMMGHSRIQMILRYAHPTQAHQTSATQKLEAHNAAQALREKAAASGLQVVKRA